MKVLFPEPVTPMTAITASSFRISCNLMSYQVSEQVSSVADKSPLCARENLPG